LFKCKIGFSDHTTSNISSQLAVALGAKCIEKHVTLNNRMSGPDHKMSLNLKDFKKFIFEVRNVDKILGSSKKELLVSEKENFINSRKSIHANIDIKIGDIFSNKNLCIKRPGNGLAPTYFEKIIGKKSKYNFKKDEKIRL
jgi:N,N'-diacetyllegionaminate synthase